MAPEDRKIRARDDLTPKPRVKRGMNATSEGRAKRVAKLRETPTNGGNVALIEQQKPDRPLTEKQKLFVKCWAEGETILSASYRAGYADSGQMGYRMSKDPAILKLYNYEKAKYEEAAQMTRKKVMDMLLESYDHAKLVSEPSSMVAAAREIGKMCGYYEPVKRTLDINVTGDVTVKRLERMSDEDLLKLVKGEITDVAFTEVEEEAEHE